MLGGHEEIVKLLIEFGADVNERFLFEINKFHGLTFLQCQPLLNDDCRKMYKNITEILIQHGAHVNDARNQATKVKFIGIRGKNNKIKDQLDILNLVLKTPKGDQKAKLQLFIERGIMKFEPRNEISSISVLLTIKAAIHHRSDIDVLELVKVLIKSGASVNGLDSQGYSALIYAVMLQEVNLVSILIKKGANVNVKSRLKEVFPLLVAARKNNLNLVKLLVSNGAEINAKNRDGQTAMDVACHLRHTKIVEFLFLNGAL